MKRKIVVLALPFLCAVVAAFAQDSSSNAVALPDPTPYQVVEQDQNHKVWQRTSYMLGPGGQVVPQTNSYIELATGLCYQDTNGLWADSQELIEPAPGGAIAQYGPHKVFFANDLTTPGAVDMRTPDGKRMRSNIIGLSYFDTATSNSVLIAEVQDCQGQIVAPNEVIYSNAFTDLSASVRYTYTKAGLEQDIILEEQPPAPEEYGLSSETTVIQVLTEFLSPPQPTIRTVTVPGSSGLRAADENLAFGVMKMGQGRAFFLGQSPIASGILTTKQWLKLDGRDVLVEQVPVSSLSQQLEALPENEGASLKPATNSVRHIVSTKRLLPATRAAAKSAPTAMRTASLKLPANGFVLDYITIATSQTNYVFQGDTTYNISGMVYVTGTNTFEGNTVIKYNANSSINLWIYSDEFNFLSTPYRPVIFTAKDDNTVGQSIGTGSPIGYYAYPALAYCPNSPPQTLAYARFCYANQAIVVPPETTLKASHCQFVQCQTGFFLPEAILVLENALFSGVVTNFSHWSASIVAENVTFSQSSYLSWLSVPVQQFQSTIALTNCILANVTALANSGQAIGGDFNGFYNCQQFGNDIFTNINGYPFQTVGGGSYYLATNCYFRGLGTANIDPTLLAALRQKTTCPPVVLTDEISGLTTLAPLGIADSGTNGSTVDLGYHYDTIDYAINSEAIYGPLVLTNGIAVACFGSGLTLTNWASFVSQGWATTRNHIFLPNAVTEQPTNWNTSGTLINLNGTNIGIYMRFTDLSCLGGNPGSTYCISNGPPFFCSSVWLQDCQLFDGTVPGLPSVSNTFKNNLFERCVFNVGINGPSGQSYNYTVLQNLFYGGSVNIAGYPIPTYTLYNNAFYYPQITGPNNLGNGYNAFITSNTFQGISNVCITNFTFAAGPLGNYYQASQSLVDKGNTTADQVGLYHYTTQTNQMIEGFSPVDIGYHYVAVDASGNPLDSNDDGIPDYIEDPNGNGVTDPGETPWGLAILVQPIDGVAGVGEPATFNVMAAGIQPLSYQWQFNGAGIAGATGATYTIEQVQTSNAGSYSVIVTNTTESITSTVATLTVLAPPLITVQPTNQTVPQGENAVFSVGVAGSGTVSYQWYFKGAPLSDSSTFSGSQSATLTVSNVQSISLGVYYVIVSNDGGDSTSLPATLTFCGVGAMWSYVAPMELLQPYLTATLLTNGQVLAVASDDATGEETNLECAELYDPVHGFWTATGPMNYPHTWPSATLLTNGQVLVVGGNQDSNSPELYDPIGRQWTVAGLFGNSRYGHTATLLASGQVLIAGGMFNSVIEPDNPYLSSAELYDPALGTWTNIAPMNLARAFHTATLLPNGQVLVAGGENLGGWPTNAEIYDPASGQWTLVTNSMNYTHSYHTATLLASGQVLVAGGWMHYTNAELYDANSGSWTTTGSLNVGRCCHAAVLMTNGQVLVAGGDSQDSILASAEIYDPGARTWTTIAPMNEGRDSLAMLWLTNMGALAVGGDSATAEIYWPQTVCPVPAITNQPRPQVACGGSTASFKVGASGAASLNYQWYNGTNQLSNGPTAWGSTVSGATAATLVLNGITSADAGNYSVTVSYGMDSLQSSAAALTVLVSPTGVTVEPGIQVAALGGTATFTASPTGTGPFYYQWQLNGTNLPGATASILAMSSLQSNQFGNYSVVVTSGVFCPVSSPIAPLCIQQSFGIWITQPKNNSNLP
jgi:hypothetical protein